jgi:glucose-1-phosphate cytidylyltransferase
MQSYKTVILCGGNGTRLGEETALKPKPMVEIGTEPILCHIMDHFSTYGLNDIILALGYKAEVIKNYFLNYDYYSNDVKIDFRNRQVQMSSQRSKDWIVNMVNTGPHTMTGGRLLRLRRFLQEGTFLLTYGDGVSNVDLHELIAFHKSHGKIATLTAVRPSGRFGSLSIDNQIVTAFREKSQPNENWINGGFFVFEPTIFSYIEGDSTVLEEDVLRQLAAEGELMAYQHYGFWECMDTVRDKNYLEELWAMGKMPWKNRDRKGMPDGDHSIRSQIFVRADRGQQSGSITAVE